MVLGSSVLLVADGRVTATSDETMISDNNLNKIRALWKDTSAPCRAAGIVGGAIEACEIAFGRIQSMGVQGIDDALVVARHGLHDGIQHIVRSNPQQSALTRVLRSAVIFGGIDSSRGAFVAAAQVDRDEGSTDVPPAFESGRHIIFSTNVEAEQLVREHLRQELERLDAAQVQNEKDYAVGVFGSVVRGIRQCSRLTTTIGGSVRGLLVSPGQPMMTLQVNDPEGPLATQRSPSPI